MQLPPKATGSTEERQEQNLSTGGLIGGRRAERPVQLKNIALSSGKNFPMRYSYDERASC